MQFNQFSQFLTNLEATPARLEMTRILAELYPQLNQEEQKIASYLLQGSLVPEYQSLEFQLSNKMVVKAIASLVEQDSQQTNLFGEATESNLENVTKLFKQKGDVGLVAAEVRKSVQLEPAQLSIEEVYSKLVEIAQAQGTGSQAVKLEKLTELFKKVSPESAKYIARMVVGRLRLGFSTMTLLDALSWAMTGSKQEAKILEFAYQKQADVGKLAQVYLSQENESKRHSVLEEYSVEVGIPVVPQLCQRLKTPEEIIEKLGEVIAEPKYDGLRVQIHLDIQKKQVHLFTRSLENITHMFPEAKTLFKQFSATNVILDAEAIGFDSTTGELLPFQQTITRKRKHGVAEQAKSVPIRFYIYDVLKVDKQGQLDVPLHERKALLEKLFKENEHIMHTPFITTKDPKELQRYHEEQLAVGLEGAVIKQIDAPYQSGRKGWYWVKMKEKTGTVGKLSDTIDGIIMGYYLGRGKRTQFGLGAILVGVLNEKQELVTIGKIGTGMTEDQLVALKKQADLVKTDSKPAHYLVEKALEPDVWIEPDIVVEVAADEVTQSPVHSAGIALRFPRLVKVRDDKSWEQATTLAEVKSMS